MRRAPVIFAICLFASWTATATVFESMSDRQLIDRSDAVVIGTVHDTLARQAGNGWIATDVHLVVEQTLKGEVPGTITISEMGGQLGTRFTMVVDGATYAPGERVLVFLKRRDDGTFFTTSMALGKFNVARSESGESIVVRSVDEIGDEPARLLIPFESFIQGATEARYLGATTTSRLRITPNSGTAKQYALFFAGMPVRWPTSSVTFNANLNGTNPNPPLPIGAGLGAWSTPNFHLNTGPMTTVSGPDPPTNPDGINAIILNFALPLSSGVCDGAEGCTVIGGNTSTTHGFDGDTWISILDADIFIGSTVTPFQFPAIMTHEAGHAIGIRHSNQGTPFCNSAIMASSVPASYGTTLQAWDKDAVNSLYGNGPACPPMPSVVGGGSVPAGASVTLSVTGIDPCANVNYQWYSGMSGDTTTPVGTNSASFTTPPITGSANYWVQVFNSCGSQNSPTVTITLQVCQKPAITVDLLDQTIASGGIATLMIGNSGTSPFNYQWYQGSAPDTSNPISGANGSQFTTPPLMQTTLYWVQVSNSCGTANSRTATITVPGSPPPCTGPPFTTQPQSVNLDPGQQTYLFATATGATSYQWYLGTAPDTSMPVTGMAPTNDRYVDQLYIDLLQRPADSGAAVLISQLNSHAATRQQVALLILDSAEYRTDLIKQTYLTYLRRNASPSEAAFWMPAFTGGITDEQFEANILASPEYFAIGGGTGSGWVTQLYNDILGRAPDGPGLAFWLGALGGGSPRTAVATALLTSPEARTRLVQSWYSRFLRRAAASSEASALVSALTGGASDEQTMAGILGGDEYFSFGTILATGPLSSTTSYWVQAGNANCSTNSDTATVTVRGCSAPAITQQPQATTVDVGGTPNVSVMATGVGPFTYQWYQGNSGDTSNPVPGATGATLTVSPMNTVGTVSFWVRVTNACKSTDSAAAAVTVTCNTGPPILINVPASVLSGAPYTALLRTDNGAYSKFELQEATTGDFSNALTLSSTNGSFVIAGHSVSTATRYFYRARGTLACSGNPGPYSQPISVVVSSPATPPPNGSIDDAGSPCPPGVSPCTLIGTITGTFTPSSKVGLSAPVAFSVTADQPWITFSPSSGTLPDSGSVSVTYTVDLTQLGTGSAQATITFSYTPQSSAGVSAFGTTTQTTPVSVSLVSPVVPQPKDANAPPNTVVLPAVAHADGVNSQFQTDVRITNTANQPITYQLTYTPSATDGSTTGMQTSVNIGAGQTLALNDIVKNWYGAGVLGQPGIGTLEIRPLNYAGKTGVNVSFATVASSRTYNTTSNGTFGQYIPAIPLVDFLGNSDGSKISLQQVVQSTAFRTNVGFLEGAGQPVNFTVTLYDDQNNAVAARPYSLRPFELQQLSLSNLFPGVSISDGRLEFQVTSSTGKLSAYTSVLDNITNDPLLVFPVDPSRISAARFVVPGVAELNNGAANFHTDMRIYNGSATSANVTLTFPANGALAPVQKQIAAGQVWAINNVLPTLWNATGGGALVVNTDSSASLVVTARTYSRRDDGGTFGQFIPGVTASDAVGVGDRPLQVVQLEQSTAFRSNLGLVEVTGNPVTVDVAAYSSDSKIAAHVQVPLGAGEFRQLGSVFTGMGITTNFYNGRISITAIGGTGRVAAYGSVIDNQTQDPTYVPAQ